jgi:hypothetical protein
MTWHLVKHRNNFTFNIGAIQFLHLHDITFLRKENTLDINSRLKYLGYYEYLKKYKGKNYEYEMLRAV